MKYQTGVDQTTREERVGHSIKNDLLTFAMFLAFIGLMFWIIS